MQDRGCIYGETAGWVQAYPVTEFCGWGDINHYLTEAFNGNTTGDHLIFCDFLVRYESGTVDANTSPCASLA